jgi:hypothetical protein
MTAPAATGPTQDGRTTPWPGDERSVAGQQAHERVKTLLIIALTLSLAGIVTVLVAFQPFAGAAGGCGGG